MLQMPTLENFPHGDGKFLFGFQGEDWCCNINMYLSIDPWQLGETMHTF